MSYDFYRILHLVVLFVLFFSLGGLWLLYEAKSNSLKSFKKILITIHGISLLIALVAGLGLIVKLAVPTPWPLWVYVKFVIWLMLGAFPLVIKRAQSISPKIRHAFFLIGLFAILLVAVITARLKY